MPRALSHVLKEDISKAQADKWLRRSNSGAPYFVAPELEDKLRAAQAVCITDLMSLISAPTCTCAGLQAVLVAVCVTVTMTGLDAVAAA